MSSLPISHKEEQALANADKTYLWHPFTQMQDWLSGEPLIIASGEGPYLYDTQGKQYLDGVSSLWVTVHGHKHPVLSEAIATQLQKIAHSTFLGLSNIPAIQLAQKLIETTPRGLQRVFYSDAGSTAVEIALKMAFQYWQHRGFSQKTKFLALQEAYHGDTIGAVSVGGIDLFHQIFRPLLFDALRVPVPYCYRCPLSQTYPSCQLACAQNAVHRIETHSETLAAVILEPRVQGAAGMIMHPEGYLRAIREACTKHNVLLILDEVATGFGRTGALFACNLEDVTPDILCIAKGITGGYLPLAATLTTEEIFSAFLGTHEERKTFFHGHTYTANPLACAVALASLSLFQTEQTLEKLQPEIERLREALSPLRDYKHVGEIRQLGFMVGIELVVDRNTKENYPTQARIGQKVCQYARTLGAILRPLGDVIVLMPPLCLHGDELVRLVKITAEAIQAITEEKTP